MLFKKKEKQTAAQLFDIDNNPIRMISEGSCDTKNCRNGCKIFSFAITGINYAKVYSNRKQLF